MELKSQKIWNTAKKERIKNNLSFKIEPKIRTFHSQLKFSDSYIKYCVVHDLVIFQSCYFSYFKDLQFWEIGNSKMMKKFKLHQALDIKWSFPIRISSVNVTKSAENLHELNRAINQYLCVSRHSEKDIF